MAATPAEQSLLIWDILKGHIGVYHIYTGAELGLFRELKGAKEGLTSSELAQRLGLHPPYVDVWCRTGYALRLLGSAGGGRFVLEPHMDAILATPGHTRYLAPLVKGFAERISEQLRSHPQRYRDGSTLPVQEWTDPAAAQRAGDASTGTHRFLVEKVIPPIPALLERLNQDGGRVLDMGCGAGGLCFRLAEAAPGCRVVGVDVRKELIEQASKTARERGLDSRLEFLYLPAQKMTFHEEFDLVVLCQVLHELAPQIRPMALRKACRALKNDGWLLIFDDTYPSDEAELRDPARLPPIVTQFMELLWGNVFPTGKEQVKLLTAAGFSDIQRRDIQGGSYTIITARRPQQASAPRHS